MHYIIEPFVKGGWGMWPILAVLIWAGYLIVERIKYLYTQRAEPREFVARMRKHLMQGDVAGAIQECRATNLPLARILAAGLRAIERDDERVQVEMDSVALREYHHIEKRTGYLAMLGNVATLMGLLGTITGLIRSFAAVGVGAGQEAAQTAQQLAAAGQSKAELLAQGISEAMNCTAFGLGTGILALLAFSILNGRTQNMLDEMNETIVHVMNLATGHREVMNLDAVRQIPRQELYGEAAV